MEPSTSLFHALRYFCTSHAAKVVTTPVLRLCASYFRLACLIFAMSLLLRAWHREVYAQRG